MSVTMDAPPVQYVTTSDGFSIAYTVAGSGTPLVVLPGTFYHVQYAWEFPGLGQWLQALAMNYQVILMDIRGPACPVATYRTTMSSATTKETSKPSSKS